MIMKKCKNCGKKFSVSKFEMETLNNKGPGIYRWCEECRKRKNVRTYKMRSLGKVCKKKRNSIFSKKVILPIILALFIAAGTYIISSLSLNYDEGTSYEISDYTEKLSFRNEKALNEHYEKHGKRMGFKSAKDYEDAANAVVFNKKVLHKIEKEDGDDVYYLQKTNELVIVSGYGYIRTYFKPESGIRYFNNQ